ncbi:MAG: rod shape-determining protein MreC [Candidatus Zixiibacteriota bacterium]|nr:MAG: rod shape-determining protein MreC [candidate division Zixibacteria bacterium]
MKWISNLFARYWRSVHFLIIFQLSLTFVFGGDQIASRVSGVVVGAFHYPFFMIRNTFVELSRVNQENQRLQQELVEFSTRFSRFEEMERENVRLRAILGFDPPAGYSLVPAKVISIAGDLVPTAAIINCGLNDSVEVDQPLINEQGLIGRVVTVASDVATVQLLTDPAHRVAVRIANSRDMGIAKFKPSQGMILDNVPVQANIKEGDLVVSSGLGGIYPPGLVVGTVVSVSRSEEEPFCDVHLETAADFNSLEELFILGMDEP